MSIESLQRIARGHALRQAESVYGIEIEIEVMAEQTRWDRVCRRELFEQNLEIWVQATQIEVLLDDRGNPVGFVDRGAWSVSTPAALDDQALLRVIRGQDSTDIAFELVSRRVVQHGAVEALLRPPGSSGVPTHRALVNPARELLIALVPAEVELP